MDPKKRFTLLFVLACAALGALACVLTALGMIRISLWYLDSCGSSNLCVAAGWLIDYWWALFVLAALSVTLLLRRLHDRRLAAASPPPG